MPRSLSRLMIAALLLSDVASRPLPARADQPRPTQPATPADLAAPVPDDPAAARAEAKRHFDKAVTLYNDEDFDAALVEFETSYQHYPAPALLYNIGLTQKILFRYVEAIASLNRYLAEIPNPPPERVHEVTQFIADMNGLLGEVTLSISPPGTAVSIDGRMVGIAPLPPVPLVAGHHLLVLEAPDHQPLHKELIVVAGQPLARSFALEAIAQSGRAHLILSPARATIRLDGNVAPAGTVEFELAAGGHTLEVSAPGFQPLRSELAIAAGQKRDITVELVPLPPKRRTYQQWWLWTPVTLGAAGLAVGLGVPFSTRTLPPFLGTLPGNGGL